MSPSFLSNFKRRNNKQSLFVRPFTTKFNKRQANTQLTPSTSKKRHIFSLMNLGSASSTAQSSGLSSSNGNSSSDVLDHRPENINNDIDVITPMDRVEIDNYTMERMHLEVEDLLASRPSCSIYTVATTLAGNKDVMKYHGMAKDNKDSEGDEDDISNNLLRSIQTLSITTTPSKYSRSQEQLKNALRLLEVRVGSSSQYISSWIDAKNVLSSVIKFPENEAEDLVKTPGAPAKALAASIPSAPWSAGLSYVSKEVQDYMERIRQATRKDVDRSKELYNIKWQQVEKSSLPTRYRLDRHFGDAAKEEPDLVDDATREKKSAIVESDEAHAEKVAKAYEDLQESRRDEALREFEAHEAEKAHEAEAMERASSLLRQLTDEEHEIVEDAMYGTGPGDEVIAQIDADSVQRVSMHRLQPGQWLNDEVIHYFYIMLGKRDEQLSKQDPSRKRSHFFKSFFMTKLLDEGNADPNKAGVYNYKNVKRWSKKVPGKDLFKLDKIFFPINVGGVHWICAVAYITEKRIQLYDSMGSEGMLYLQSIFRYLKDEHLAKKGSPMPDEDEWELLGTSPNTPRQQNGFDCGVFTCMFADFLSTDCPLRFSQQHITQCRQRIALSIMNGSAII